MIEFRTIRPGEWPEAMQLWTTVFGDVGWIFESLNIATEPRLLGHTRVAVSEGRIVSAVDIFIREQRDARGNPRKVGAIGSVATYDEFRGRGLSGQLLKDAITAMTDAGCDWSFLATGVPNHYARYGWFITPLRYTQGKLRSPLALVRSEYVKELEVAGSLPFSQLGEIYDEFNAVRPLTHLRTAHYWEHAIKIRLNQPGMRLFVYEEGERIAGYLAASFNSENLEVVEIGARSGREDVIRPLLETCALESETAGLHDWVFALAIDDSSRDVVERLVGDLKPIEASWTMSRSMSDSFGEDEIREMFAAKGATHYHLDRF